MNPDNKTKSNVLGDRSLWLLVFSNIITILLATKEGWNLSTVAWIYWFQSVVIGTFNFVRIIGLREFSVEGLKVNGREAVQRRSTKNFIAFFFLFHYGFFHLIYAILIADGVFSKANWNGSDFVDLKYVFIVALLFFLNHLFSYVYNKTTYTNKINIGFLMFYPYARIIPMHLAMFLVFYFSSSALILFLILKTLADVGMHIMEHNIFITTKTVSTS